MKISSSHFEAFLNCRTKCWLRATGNASSANSYAEWVKSETALYRDIESGRFASTVQKGEIAIALSQDSLKANGWRLALGSVVHGEMDSWAIESDLHAIECLPSEGKGRTGQFIPIRFIARNKLGEEDRLLLGFDALVLSQAFRCDVSLGNIVHGDDKAISRVNTAPLAHHVRTAVQEIAKLLSSASEPDLLLNRHCAECEFHAQCREKAIERDELSLLAGMSEKERNRLHNKGIFTITQLSYTFRPRRHPKRFSGKGEKYHHSLKALAIRERKIHIVGHPEIKIEGTPVYLDSREFQIAISVTLLALVSATAKRQFSTISGLTPSRMNERFGTNFFAYLQRSRGRCWFIMEVMKRLSSSACANAMENHTIL